VTYTASRKGRQIIRDVLLSLRFDHVNAEARLDAAVLDDLLDAVPMMAEEVLSRS
jgi:hypothetical protein